jgi:alkyldihydroxyacetonephosphate synthase
MTRIGDLAPVGCRLIVGFEGEAQRAQTGIKAALAILAEAGGADQGEEPGQHWFEHRYDVSFKQSKIFYAGAFNDTMEVAVPWSRVMSVYDAVRRSVSQHGFIMAHFSHAYPDGCSIYFTFAGYRERPDESEELYDRIWSQALRTASAEGATLSHHHGIGLAKRALMAEEHGDGERVFAALKRTFDPNGIMNPGKVFAGRYHKGRRSGTAG